MIEIKESEQERKWKSFQMLKKQLKGSVHLGDFDGFERLMADKKDQIRYRMALKALKKKGV